MNTAAQGEAPGEGVVADYLANRLSEPEAQAFELYCLQHPEFASDVERELAFKTGLRQVHELGTQAGARKPRRPFGRWPLALAASVVVLASAVLVYQYSSNRLTSLAAFTSVSDLPEQLRRAAVSEVRLVRMRGNEAVTRVSASANGVVDIRLMPDLTPQSGIYSMQISAESPSSTKPLIVRGLRPRADGYLQLYVPANQVIGRTWLISLAEDGDFAKSQNVEAFRVQFLAASESAH